MVPMRPTHRLIATGDLVFPEGYDPSEVAEIGSDEQAAMDLAKAKAIKWAGVVAKRKALRAQGFAVSGYPARFQSDDEEGLINLIAATLAAVIAIVTAQPFSVNWTLANNSTVTLSKTQMVTVFIAGVSAFMAIQTRSRELRALIEAANTVDAVDAIDSEAGWP